MNTQPTINNITTEPVIDHSTVQPTIDHSTVQPQVRHFCGHNGGGIGPSWTWTNQPNPHIAMSQVESNTNIIVNNANSQVTSHISDVVVHSSSEPVPHQLIAPTHINSSVSESINNSN